MLPADLPEAERRQAIEATLLRREGRPENVAHAVFFLIDNDFVTGVCLPVDGGRSIFSADQREYDKDFSTTLVREMASCRPSPVARKSTVTQALFF